MSNSKKTALSGGSGGFCKRDGPIGANTSNGEVNCSTQSLPWQPGNSSLWTTLSAWIASLRLGTILLSSIAILQGSALAAWHGMFDPVITVLALTTAALLQILCNLANDYGDVLKGTDGQLRIGPRRALHTGVISMTQMRFGLWTCSSLCVISGATLITYAVNSAEAALSFVLLGLLCIAAALAYTLGRYAYGYLGLGDLSVLIFFGWTGVAGSYVLQTGGIDLVVFWPATACGLFAVATLNINNLRDIKSDARSNKKTLAVRLGPKRARYYHMLVLILAFLCLVIGAIQTWNGWRSALFALALPWLVVQACRVVTNHEPRSMLKMLAPTVLAGVLTQALFLVGLVL
jgi:1,4-dihydroxy-2-naphthoate octaprenyltransferase